MPATAAELRARIAARPWEAIGLALAIGAFVAFDRSGRARRAVLSTLGTMALGTLRGALSRPSPRSWIDLAKPGWAADHVL